jgi:hypothetical protein
MDDDTVGRDQRSIHRRLTTARRYLRQMDVIPARDRVINAGNTQEISRLLTELEELL